MRENSALRSAPFPNLGCFERPAAFQATGFVARRDESAKRAYSLCGKIAIVRFHSQEFPQRSGQESTQTTNTDKKWMRDCDHDGTPLLLTIPIVPRRGRQFCAT